MTNEAKDNPELVPASTSGGISAIFMVGMVGLFIELLLIRWISTEVRIFAYLQNTVLVVCFLGLGMGCFTCRKPASLRDMLEPLLIWTLLLAIPVSRLALRNLSLLLSLSGDLVIWFPGEEQPRYLMIYYLFIGLGMTYFLLFLIWSIFVPIGRLLGRLLNDHPQPIWAYSVNVAGSLVGTWLFVLLSAMQVSPIVWFFIFALMLLPVVINSRVDRNWNLGMLAVFLVVAFFAQYEPNSLLTNWSPYQKLALEPGEPPKPGLFRIQVNNVSYQGILDLRPTWLRENPEKWGSSAQALARMQENLDITKDEAVIGHTQYDIPYLFHPKPRKVLIVGAGSGNDASGALRNGAQEVVAVEIDPVIVAMGKAYHPEKPYDSSKVRVVVDDARSFFARTEEKFDVIVFGLLDSHTTTAMTNARLDHYVYTKESLARAKELLQPGGVMVLSFDAEKGYITDRMATVLRDTFGVAPLSFFIPYSGLGYGGMQFVAGDQKVIQEQLQKQPHFRALVEHWQKNSREPSLNAAKIATDDWPYIYLESPKIPLLYFMLTGILILLYVVGARRMGEVNLLPKLGREQWHFAFLGAAFLLLEVQNISKAAVALGNTWDVNAVIISAVLMMVLLANALSARWPTLPLFPVYCLLLGSCLGLYFVDLARFASLPYAVKAVVVGGLATIPMLFSGIVFVRSFTATSAKDEALGANLFGSLVGGVLQSITFVTGIKALLLLVAALYLGAILTRPKSWT